MSLWVTGLVLEAISPQKISISYLFCLRLIPVFSECENFWDSRLKFCLHYRMMLVYCRYNKLCINQRTQKFGCNHGQPFIQTWECCLCIPQPYSPSSPEFLKLNWGHIYGTNIKKSKCQRCEVTLSKISIKVKPYIW